MVFSGFICILSLKTALLKTESVREKIFIIMCIIIDIYISSGNLNTIALKIKK